MKVLVVVDMQNDFIDGTLGTPEALYNDAKKEISEETEKKTDEEKEVKE